MNGNNLNMNNNQVHRRFPIRADKIDFRELLKIEPFAACLYLKNKQMLSFCDRIASYGIKLVVKHVYAHTNLNTFEVKGSRIVDEYLNIDANKI